MERQTVLHTLEPVYDRNSRALVLGTMPSPKSREEGFYYAHPQNRFWAVLSRLFETGPLNSREEKIRFLLDKRIALWDVLASCEIAGADDNSILRPVPNDLSGILRVTGLRSIFTTGKKATVLYEKYIFPQTGIKACGLPSTSPANAKMRLPELVEAYRPLLDVV